MFFTPREQHRAKINLFQGIQILKEKWSLFERRKKKKSHRPWAKSRPRSLSFCGFRSDVDVFSNSVTLPAILRRSLFRRNGKGPRKVEWIIPRAGPARLLVTFAQTYRRWLVAGSIGRENRLFFANRGSIILRHVSPGEAPLQESAVSCIAWEANREDLDRSHVLIGNVRANCFATAAYSSRVHRFTVFNDWLVILFSDRSHCFDEILLEFARDQMVGVNVTFFGKANEIHGLHLCCIIF